MQDRRTEVDVTPPGNTAPDALVEYGKTLVGRQHSVGGKVIGEVRNVKVVNGRLIAEVKLAKSVILG